MHQPPHGASARRGSTTCNRCFLVVVRVSAGCVSLLGVSVRGCFRAEPALTRFTKVKGGSALRGCPPLHCLTHRKRRRADPPDLAYSSPGPPHTVLCRALPHPMSWLESAAIVPTSFLAVVSPGLPTHRVSRLILAGRQALTRYVPALGAPHLIPCLASGYPSTATPLGRRSTSVRMAVTG